MKLTALQRDGAAETADNMARENCRDIAEVIEELVENGLHKHCTVEELTEWHRRWKKKQRAAERWQQGEEIPVDPADLEQHAGNDAGMPEEDREGMRPFRPGEIAGGMLRMMDRRLLRDTVKWREVAAALRWNETIIEKREGAGRERQADGAVIEWVAFAVLTQTDDGAVCRVFPECRFVGTRAPGSYRTTYGMIRLRQAVVVRRADSAGTLQCVGTLLLLYKGEAAQVRTHAGLASVTGGTRANGSAKARRMAVETIKTGGRASFSIIRRRETVGRKWKEHNQQQQQRREEQAS